MAVVSLSTQDWACGVDIGLEAGQRPVCAGVGGCGYGKPGSPKAPLREGNHFELRPAAPPSLGPPLGMWLARRPPFCSCRGHKEPLDLGDVFQRNRTGKHQEVCKQQWSTQNLRLLLLRPQDPKEEAGRGGAHPLRKGCPSCGILNAREHYCPIGNDEQADFRKVWKDSHERILSGVSRTGTRSSSGKH
ncbi:uncharacterized protein LOC141518622 isoform X2 [Macrotis lagotis]